MGAPEPAVADFETEAIEGRPHYPPKPVGLALKLPGRPTKYFAWGHPSKNNCAQADAQRALGIAYKQYRMLFHNGPFDMEVAQKHFGLPLLVESNWHDSMITAYLRDPHAHSLALKEVAAARLGMPPAERDELQDWILANVPGARQAKKQWAAHIAKAPGDLVGRYAIGDVERTLKLWKEDYAYVENNGMLEAYRRERRIIPMLLANSQRGVRVDLARLRKEVPLYDKQLDKTVAWVRARLKAPDLDLDKNEELANALEKAGKVGTWLLTETGLRSVSKESLDHALKDDPLRVVLQYHAALSMCLGTFLKPWLRAAEENNGFVQIDWNSTRQDQYGRGGSRTGRISSTPNFQNIYSDENLERAERGALALNLDWWALPRVRGFILADDDASVLCDRDFNSQELRVLAHFEDGAMREAYEKDPKLDLHAYAANLIKERTGIELTRKAVKITGFSLIYGAGAGKLAEQLGISYDEARGTRDAYLNTFPGVREIQQDLKVRGQTKQPMRTWGGRLYYAEEPKVINGRVRDFSYKLLNYLVQGSSADITKEAMLQYTSESKHGRFVLTVHDEIIISAPKQHWKSEMSLLREAMNGIQLSVPMLSTGMVGPRWVGMEECK